MSFQTPGGPAAKRRRIEAANATLRKPFRSPLAGRQKEKGDKPEPRSAPGLGDAQRPSSTGTERPTTVGSSTNTILTATPPPTHTRSASRRPVAASPLSTATTAGANFSPSRHDTAQNDVDGDNLLQQLSRSQTQLQTHLRAAEARLHLVQQAHQIEQRAAKAANDTNTADPNPNPDTVIDVDAELRGMIARWKTTSRLAADELFGLIRDRVEGMGGAKAWRASRQWQRSGGGFGFADGNESGSGDSGMVSGGNFEGNGGELASDGEEGTEGNEGDEDKGQGEEVDEETEESEFTMTMMLESLNIEPSILGYDPVEDKWKD
ncbi:uncharacterized protein C8A04DRAFT_27813 [Dichotomopilus funicola]|uniref:Uncharacterized protein n=1 Tax=Dichotomopilus funicola TaxID=1934379 RepID=A0AAN6V414_9PEZI|nr:hypothetical protein C8A04DRAFT_27813 [Dichotomopilus funicola]